MRKYRYWLAGASIAAAAALVMVAIQWQRARSLATPEALWKRLPARDAVVLYVDFAALRRTGLLQIAEAQAVAAEPEYREFVERTKFDYSKDLDAALVAFAPSGRYFLVRGRFDWPRLRAHAAASGGGCRDRFCTMAGSTPERKISFVPLADEVMALAVSPDDMAAEVLRHPDPAAAVPPDMPADPVWLTLAGSALKSKEPLPPGTRMFARNLENAERIVLSLGPEERRFALRMEVRCRSEKEAAELAEAMKKATETVQTMIARENQRPNPRDLSGVLWGGTFSSVGTRMKGHWPVERVFFEEIFGGQS